MKEFVTRDNEKVQLDIASYKKIEQLSSQKLPTYNLNNMGDCAFVGFAYFGPTLPFDLKRVDPDHDYSKETKLSRLEIQPQRNFKKENYHKAIIASVDQTLVGILVCEWVKFSNEYWHYYIRYIDIHKDHKNQSVGTNLIKTLDQSDFIKNKILYLGMLSEEGEKYIAPVIKRELKAKDYALVFEDYHHKTPTRFGKFGGKYWG